MINVTRMNQLYHTYALRLNCMHPSPPGICVCDNVTVLECVSSAWMCGKQVRWRTCMYIYTNIYTFIYACLNLDTHIRVYIYIHLHI